MHSLLFYVSFEKTERVSKGSGTWYLVRIVKVVASSLEPWPSLAPIPTVQAQVPAPTPCLLYTQQPLLPPDPDLSWSPVPAHLVISSFSAFVLTGTHLRSFVRSADSCLIREPVSDSSSDSGSLRFCSLCLRWWLLHCTMSCLFKTPTVPLIMMATFLVIQFEQLEGRAFSTH